MFCDFFRPNDCPRNKDEERLWPKAKPDTVCETCKKRYDEHPTDRLLSKAVICDGKSYILTWW